MATVLPTSLPVILPLIQQRIMAVLQFPQERVLISCRPEDTDEPHIQATQYVRMRALGATPNQADWEGMERVATVHSRKLRVTLFTRLNLDDVNTDQVWATESQIGLGHYVAEHQLFNALYAFFPTDRNGNSLVWYGLNPAPVSETSKNAKKNDGWGRSSVECDIVYVLALPNLNNV